MQLLFPQDYHLPDSAQDLEASLKDFSSRGQDFFADDVANGREKAQREQWLEWSSEWSESFDHVVLCGIGGSALGPHFLFHALSQLSPEMPELHILDTVDPESLAHYVAPEAPLDRTLFLFVSKSGSTPETLSQFSLFTDALSSRDLSLADHCIVITDRKSGPLGEMADALGMRHLTFSPDTGGRFSLFTPVGLLPSALTGLDIESLLAGYEDQKASSLSPDPGQNLAWQLALFQYEQLKQGRGLAVMMTYADRLELLGDWYAQLLAESTGKQNASGQPTGFTPLSASGVRDQHSQLQLYSQGPDDKHYLWVQVEEPEVDITIPGFPVDSISSDLSTNTFGQLFSLEREATARSLEELGRPLVRLSLPRVDAYCVGQITSLLMGSIVHLGSLLQINAFDQPGVERSKELTREGLKEG